MKDKPYTDPRVGAIIKLLLSLEISELNSKEILSAPGDDLDKIIFGLNKIKTESLHWNIFQQNTEDKLNEFLEAIVSMATLKFDKTAPIGETGDVFDALATGLNQLSEELQSSTVSTSYFKSIINSMPDSLIVIRENGSIESVNNATIKLLGYNESELVGSPISKIMALSEKKEDVSNYFFTPENKNDVELLYQASDGTQIPVLFSASIIKSENGEFEGVICVAHNISDKKANEKEKLKLISLVENSNDFIAIGSLDGKVEFLNKGGKKLVGLSESENIEGKTVSDFLTYKGYQQFQKIETPAVRKHGSWSGENSLRHFVTGESIPVTKNTFIILDKTTKEPLGIGTVQRDIRKEKEDRHKLIKSEIALKEAQKIGKVGSWELDLVNNKLYWSEEIYRLLGIELFSIDANYETFLSYIHPEDRDKVNNAYTNHIERREEYSIVHRLLSANGETKYVHERCESEWNEEGQPIRSLGTSTDVTEQKLVELELEEYKSNLEKLVHDRTKDLKIANEELEQATIELQSAYLKLEQNKKQYEFLAKHSSDAVLAYDAQLNFTYISPSIVKLTGYSVEEVAKMSPGELVHPEDLKEQLTKFKNAIANKKSQDTFRYRRKVKYGAYAWVEAVSSYIYDSDGNLTNIVINLRDITQKKTAEDKLQASRNFNELLFKKSRIGLALKTLDGELIDVNQSFADIIGHTIEETIGMNTWDLTPDSYKKIEVEKYESLRIKGSYKPFEKEYIHKNGNLIPVRLQGTVINRNGEDLIWSSVENISERKSTENKLEAAKNQLIISEKMASLGVLTAGVAHEINNPVNFIYAGINSLEENLNDVRKVIEVYEQINTKNTKEKLSEIQNIKEQVQFEKLMKFVDRSTTNIKKGAERTSEIIKGLKTFSRSDDSQLVISSINENIETTLLVLRNQYMNRIKIEKKLSNSIPKIKCYPGKLNQVFVNIVANAIQAIDNKGVIKLATNTAKVKGIDYVKIEISDSGKGIDKETQQRIFEPFYTTKEVGKGTGLGLSISHSIIENHKGFIEVESTIDIGTTFKIYLPIK